MSVYTQACLWDIIFAISQPHLWVVYLIYHYLTCPGPTIGLECVIFTIIILSYLRVFKIPIYGILLGSSQTYAFKKDQKLKFKKKKKIKTNTHIK